MLSEHEIDETSLMLLDRASIEQLGIKLGPKLILMRKIADLNKQSSNNLSQTLSTASTEPYQSDNSEFFNSPPSRENTDSPVSSSIRSIVSKLFISVPVFANNNTVSLVSILCRSYERY